MDGDRRLRWLIAAAGPDAGRRPRTRRDWIVDVLCLLLAIALGAIAGASTYYAGHLPGELQAVDIALGVASLPLLFWRRRYPVQLLLLVSLASVVSASASGAQSVLLFSVAVHRPLPVAVGSGIFMVLLYPVFLTLHPRPEIDTMPWWGDTIISLAITAVIVGWGAFVRARRQLVLLLAQRVRDAEANQAERVSHARDEERARIAREMHDVLGHRLSLLSLHAGALEFRTDASPDEVARAAGVIRAASHDALNELRSAIGVLREIDSRAGGGPAPPQPTLGDLDRLLGEWRAAGVRVEATVETAVQDVPAALGRAAYRIVQEGLTNASKHAPGAVVRVTVTGALGGRLVVDVRNPLSVAAGRGRAHLNGGSGGLTTVGVEVSSRPSEPAGDVTGTGLIGLHERAELSGGLVERAGPRDGEWVLRVWLPWPA